MSHATIRATILPEIVKMISKEQNISEKEAMDMFYTSATGASFADDETGLSDVLGLVFQINIGSAPKGQG